MFINDHPASLFASSSTLKLSKIEVAKGSSYLIYRWCGAGTAHCLLRTLCQSIFLKKAWDLISSAPLGPAPSLLLGLRSNNE